MLLRHKFLALVRCYIVDCDAAMGIMLTHLQKAHHSATQAVGPVLDPTSLLLSTSGELGLVGTTQARNLEQ